MNLFLFVHDVISIAIKVIIFYSPIFFDSSTGPSPKARALRRAPVRILAVSCATAIATAASQDSGPQ